MTFWKHSFAHVPDCHPRVCGISLSLVYPVYRWFYLVFIIVLVQIKLPINVWAECRYADPSDVFSDLKHVNDVINKSELFAEVGSPDAVGHVK